MELPEFLSAEDVAGYEKGSHGGRSGFGECPAVLVVDFTNGFVDPSYSLAAGESGFAAVKQTRRVLDAARGVGVPVLFTRLSLLALSNPAVGSISRKRVAAAQALLAVPGSNDLADVLGRRPDEPIFEKTSASAFFGTDVLKTLIYHRVDTLIITGASTSGCLRASVVDAAAYNYFVIVPEQCVSDRSPTSDQMTLFEIDQKYGDVIGVEEVLDHLQGLGEARR